MISVGLSTLFVIYLLSFLAMILTLWIVYELRRKASQVEPLEQRIFRCTICAHVYLDDRDEAYSRCPRCDSLNEAPPIAGRTGNRQTRRFHGIRRARTGNRRAR